MCFIWKCIIEPAYAQEKPHEKFMQKIINL